MSAWKLETGNWKPETGKAVPPTSHSERSEESASSVLHRHKQIPRRFAPRNDRAGLTFEGATGGADLTAIGPNPEPRIPNQNPDPVTMTTVPNAETQVSNPRTLPLLIEIGCEEIPARFLADAQRDLGEQLREALREVGLLGGAGREGAVPELPLQTYSTPRRMVAYFPEVLEKQPDKVEEVRGPAAKAAFDAQGNPTRAAESFAAKNGAAVQDLIRVSTPKGEYVAVQKRTSGQSALKVLPEVLPQVVTNLSFPKSMYWEMSKTRFVRPIRWILALLGAGEHGRVISIEIAGVRSGNVTYGHRTHGMQPIGVTDFGDYSKRLRAALVEFDPVRRREALQAELRVVLHVSMLSDLKGSVEQIRDSPIEPNDMEQLRSVVSSSLELSGFHVVEDKELEDWIVSSTEWPRAFRGSFHERFLKLPREILTTVMRDHQKYFAVESAEGEIHSQFVAVLNVDRDPNGQIRAGHERVLTARFSDAEFFWNTDQKIPLRDRLPMLERVTYQVKLGSYGDKVRRMEAIARRLCADLEEQGRLSPQEAENAARAVELCKCDLTTQMVQEFTELQGIVGGLYAAVQGEPKEVADAIYDHYKPVGVDDQLPRGIVGAIVSLADKIDAVVGGFVAGLEPTGSSDPFGLRRQGNAVIKVLVEFSLPIILPRLLVGTAKALGRDWHALLDPIAKFFDERMKFYLETVAGCRYDTVRAVIAKGLNIPAEALKRARAVEKIRDSEDYVALTVAAKRTRNILRKSASPEEYKSGQLNPGLLEQDAEVELYQAYSAIFGQVTEGGILSGDYDTMLTLTARLRPAIDRFFDQVLVMHEDPSVRRNRLLLLALLDEKVFSRVADLSEIEGNLDASTSRRRGCEC